MIRISAWKKDDDQWQTPSHTMRIRLSDIFLVENESPHWMVKAWTHDETFTARMFCYFNIHELDTERFERFIDGTDSPMYDLVHELRYGPVIGIHKTSAEHEFNNLK